MSDSRKADNPRFRRRSAGSFKFSKSDLLWIFFHIGADDWIKNYFKSADSLVIFLEMMTNECKTILKVLTIVKRGKGSMPAWSWNIVETELWRHILELLYYGLFVL